MLSSKNKYIIVVNVILLFFFIVNLISLFNRDIFVDEAITYNIVNKLSFKKLISGIDVHPPLYYVLMKILPHNNFYSLRLYSLVIMTVALSLLFYYSDKFFTNKRIPFTILFISVLSHTISRYGTEARMYSLLFLLSVLIISSFLNKKYNITLSLIIISLFTHYYAIFLLIPFLGSFLFTDRKLFYKYLIKATIITSISLLILSPYIYNQFFSENNPYKVPPPHSKVTLISLPSMLIFPFVIPSNINTLIQLVLSYIIIFIIIFLITTFRYGKDKELLYFLLFSFFTTILLYFLSLMFNVPYHHRYTIMFFPMIYLILSLSIENKMVNIRYTTYFLLLVFLAMTFSSFHMNPNNQFLEISETIECPKNILHETPFSYIPLSLYLPNCNHYMAKSEDWTELTYETLYTTEDKINNYNVSYDIYFHYFEEFKVPELLNRTNITTLQLIKVKD